MEILRYKSPGYSRSQVGVLPVSFKWFYEVVLRLRGWVGWTSVAGYIAAPTTSHCLHLWGKESVGCTREGMF